MNKLKHQILQIQKKNKNIIEYEVDEFQQNSCIISA